LTKIYQTPPDPHSSPTRRNNDIYTKYGLEAIYQTDLDQRVHENQPTRELGKMAFGILQTFIKRAQHLGMFNKMDDFQTILRQAQAEDNEYTQAEFEIKEEERPPMIEIETYREKFNRTLDLHE